MQLPELFEEKMKGLLGAEYDEFRRSYGKERRQALRVNPAKLSAAEMKERSPFTLEPVPWAKNGFYYGAEDRPGRHPWHEAGVYYIQEPSAMSVAELAGYSPGSGCWISARLPAEKARSLRRHWRAGAFWYPMRFTRRGRRFWPPTWSGWGSRMLW